MFPLIPLGPIVLPTYSLALLLALWVGTWLAAWRATQLQIHSDHVHNVSFYGVLVGLSGARLWYVLTHWQTYSEQPSQAFILSPIALAVPEGFFFAAGAALIYLRQHRLPLSHFIDAVAPGLALALMIVHLGRLLSGQGLGQPSDLPWAINLAQATRHPIELYYALACGLLLVAMLATRKYLPWPSFQFWAMVALYGLTHLILTPWYEQPPLVGSGLLMGQIIGLLGTVVALAVMAYNFTSQHQE